MTTVPKSIFTVSVLCPEHGRRTIYEGLDRQEAEKLYLDIEFILNRFPGCTGERVQFFERPFNGKLIKETVEKFSEIKRDVDMNDKEKNY